MSHQKFVSLIESLIQKTIDRAIEWESTANEGAFRLLLPNGLVRVSLRGGDQYEVILRDPVGRLLESIKNDNNTSFAVDNLLRQLHDVARSSALKVDVTMDAMLKSIERGEHLTFQPDGFIDPDEDLPF